jgi:hypothetical protein
LRDFEGDYTMPYKDYTIERAGDNYTIRKPNGERMEAGTAATLATAKKWIDLDIAERQAHARRWATWKEAN